MIRNPAATARKSFDDERAGRAAAGLAGLLLLVSAGLSGRLALEHMHRLGAICGSATAHCAWCPTALGLALTGAGVLAFAVRRRSVPGPVVP